jgi:hypothetical protein
MIGFPNILLNCCRRTRSRRPAVRPWPYTRKLTAPSFDQSRALAETPWPALPTAKTYGRPFCAPQAAKLGVSHHQIRKLIKAGVLKSEQIMPDAPHRIRAADLEGERVTVALKQKGRPCRVDPENQISMFSNS